MAALDNPCLWTAGRLDMLIDADLVKAQHTLLTPQGVSKFDQLHASGYRATREQVRGCLHALKIDSEHIDGLVDLILTWKPPDDLVDDEDLTPVE